MAGLEMRPPAIPAARPARPTRAPMMIWQEFFATLCVRLADLSDGPPY